MRHGVVRLNNRPPHVHQRRPPREDCTLRPLPADLQPPTADTLFFQSKHTSGGSISGRQH